LHSLFGQHTGGVSITANTIDGNLQCKENNPAPTGGDNIVKGIMEDQCANLSSAEETAQPDPPADGNPVSESQGGGGGGGGCFIGTLIN
jgi:hypothetical protein